jgi:AmmeMemoRadiSam system protein B
MAHENEHSIEVQLPFLQHRFGDNFKFVPISILNEFADETLLEVCRVIGKGIASVIKKQKEKWIVLASSDFSHYVPQERAKKTDKYVIKAILNLDEKDFFARINEKDASVCGFGPIAIAIVAAKELGAKKGELLKYSTSGDVTGDFGAVVGYSSIIFK